MATHDELMGRTAVYRFTAENGLLLYVGITKHPPSRFAQHRASKKWWRLVTDTSIVWYPSRHKAEQVERQAIELERPLFNSTFSVEEDVWNRLFRWEDEHVLTHRRIVSFARVVRSRPEALDLLLEVRKIDVDLCPDCLWPPLKQRIGLLAGMGACDSDDPWIYSAEAYDATIATIYEALPLRACGPCGAA